MCKIEEDGFCGIWGDRLQESNLRWRQMTWQSKKIRKKNIVDFGYFLKYSYYCYY